MYEYSLFMNKVFRIIVPAVHPQLKCFRCHNVTKSKKISQTLRNLNQGCNQRNQLKQTAKRALQTEQNVNEINR